MKNKAEVIMARIDKLYGPRMYRDEDGELQYSMKSTQGKVEPKVPTETRAAKWADGCGK